MKRSSVALAAGLLAIGGVSVAWGAGLFPNLPIVGGASYSSGLGTVAAGPSALTGSENVPADTGLASGVAPQTVLVPTSLLASGAFTRIPQASVTSPMTIPNNVTNYLVDYSTTYAALSLTMPASPLNGQVVRVNSTYTITALTVSANTNQTMAGTAPTALTPSATAAGGYAWVYDSSSAKWFRLQ